VEWRSGRRGREDVVVQRNLKEVVEAASAFCTSNACTRLVLGGTDQNVSRLYDMLPKALQDQVIGSFSVDVAHQKGRSVPFHGSDRGDGPEARG